MKKNICFFIGSFEIGGAQKHLIEILKSLDSSLFSPYICTFSLEGKLKHEYKNLIYLIKV
tara:strand:- start:758 stop:937 length:180 start_codon:yes stop_codon:yes gene_type:complete